ncbi:aldehyde dehydrogenase family protein [Capillimicrobium parvum]|uniref:L-glutamate gamma-semialdehyde dehydrogenase n=1 Tax=Capillimicrobium parvum TaxID=2884022 RepID=A0A9E6Y5L2_9ACTN|nr:aldehyde dehydrogenase family protein [Capillimicrobium parvum]UGS39006.1 1-pyrroline-5-carboxylate dehydrogenase 2 [Capillimicrobium parvum]
MSSITYATVYTQGLGDDEKSRAYERELTRLREAGSPRACGHHIAGQEIDSGPAFDRADPSDASRVVSRGRLADGELVDRAVAAAREALPDWRRTDYHQRAEILRRTLQAIERRHVELAALLTLETGKTRADAFAEVAECAAIVELYCNQVTAAEGFVVAHRPPSPTSHADVVLLPYGVFGVISPFNFPLAISFGMTAAALIMGNTVVFKPSPLTPACGQAFAQLFDGVGLPTGVLNLVQGGSETGQALAGAAVDGIAFTGSADVGLDFVARFGRPPFVRPVLAEMGGKNPAIVTDAAGDLDTAARAVARSAFGMSGQKCNACSRAIVTDGVYDDFIERLCAITSELVVADPIDASAFTGPVISDSSVARFQESVALARQDGRVLVGGGSAGGPGHFVELTLVDRLPSAHPLTRDELFVPIVSVVRAGDLDEALAEANAIRYGLSAGIFSNDPRERERFLDEIEAGIVFLNNPGGATTGVWPGSQTMSGWKGSGSAGKGGFGPWYLHQFGREQSRTVFDVA